MSRVSGDMMEKPLPIIPSKMVLKILRCSPFTKINKAIYGLAHTKEKHIDSMAIHLKNSNHDDSITTEGIAAANKG